MSVGVELYRQQVLIRKAEEAIIRYYPEDDMKTPMHMSMGEEAIVVGVCHALGASDQVTGTYRSHALYLALTGETDRFFAEMYGKVTGAARGRGGSMHLSAPDKGLLCCSAVVASTIPFAVGVALAIKMRGKEAVAVTFFGDGATDAGVFWESVNYACLEKLPVLFVHEDNGLAVHTPREKRNGYDSIADVLSGFNCHYYEAATTDVEEIHQLARTALQDMRTDRRPAFLNLGYYRYLEHVGIYDDFDAGYRSKAEFEAWYKVDPLARQRRAILERGEIGESELKFLEQEVQEQVDLSVERAKQAEFAEKGELLEKVFHEAD